jgi:hypothetical protein
MTTGRRTHTLGDGMQDSDVSGSYPRAGAVYDGEPASIGAARDLVAAFLKNLQDEYAIPIARDAVDIALLVVSELVTNACKYAPGPCVVDIETDGVFVQIAVWDSEVLLPRTGTAGPGRIGQHGLEIVLALCAGLDIQPQPAGKRIAARVPLV